MPKLQAWQCLVSTPGSSVCASILTGWAPLSSRRSSPSSPTTAAARVRWPIMSSRALWPT
eukprot:scaffold656240_cov94-Prasinocladus_malaysianus.AAC.1